MHKVYQDFKINFKCNAGEKKSIFSLSIISKTKIVQKCYSPQRHYAKLIPKSYCNQTIECLLNQFGYIKTEWLEVKIKNENTLKQEDALAFHYFTRKNTKVMTYEIIMMFTFYSLIFFMAEERKKKRKRQ